MKPTVLYELRVLNGEQRGASSAVRPGDLLRIGQDWSNDVVLQGAAALGHSIPESYADFQMSRTPPLGAYKPSSLLDWQAGRELEVESIWGEPVRRAAAAGCALPRMEMLYRLLRALAVHNAKR